MKPEKGSPNRRTGRIDGQYELSTWLVRALALWAFSIAAWAQGYAAPDTTHPRVAEAVERGFWRIKKGESLNQITRKFFPKQAEQRRQLRAELLSANDVAFIKGDATKIVVGAKLKLPESLRIAARAVPAIAATPPTTASALPTKPSAPVAATTPAAPVAATTPPAPVAATTPPAPTVAAAPPAPPSPAAEPPKPAPPAKPEAAKEQPPLDTLAKGDDPPPISARAPPKVEPKGPAYVDRLIDENVGPDTEGAAGARSDPEAEPQGQRLLAVDLRTDWRSSGGSSLFESGIGVQYRRELVNLGEIFLEAAARDAQRRLGGRTVDREQGGNFTLYQLRAPVMPGFFADTVLGTLRTTPRSLVGSGFRVNIPAPLLFGASSILYGEADRYYAQAGRAVRLIGAATQQAQVEEARLATVGADVAIDPQWRLGLQGNAFRLKESEPTRGSGALAVQWRQDRTLGGKIAALADDASRSAVWLEADTTVGRMLHRYGAYRFDRDIAYSTVPLISDEQTIYWRGDYRDRNLTASGSVDVIKTNLDREPERSGHDTLAGSGTVNLRVSRTLSVGGSLALRHERPRTAVSNERRVNAETAFLRLATNFGTSSFDAAHYDSRSSNDAHERIVSLGWNHSWPQWGPLYITTSLSGSNERDVAGKTRRRLAGVTARSEPFTGFSFDLNLLYGIVDRPAGREKDLNATINATWQFLPDWQLQLFGIYNRIDLRIPDPTMPTPITTDFSDKGVQLVVRYAKASGVPIIPLGGRATASAGAGRIHGRVFFDENGDGLYQPTERVAARLTVILDDRYPATTDSEGRFEFPLVSVGQHTLKLSVENLPLPWGVADETPVAVNVPLRGDVLVELPLSRLN